MVKAIIFDADHTLYTPKTEKAYEAQFKHLADQLGVGRERIKEIWRQQIDRVIGVKDPEERRRETALERTLMELELPVDSKEQLAEDAVQHFWNQVVEDLEYSGKTPQILEKLEERGVELLAVASDEFKRPLERKLNKVLGSWKDYFNHLITPRETESMKPSEEFYNSVLEKEGLDPADVAMVGDSWKRDLEPAQRCGLITILVSEEKKGDPDFHIKNLEELEEIMDEF